MCEAASFSAGVKILLKIAGIVGFVRIVRKKPQHALLIELIPIWSESMRTSRPPRFNTTCELAKDGARRTLGGSSWNVEMLVTAFWVSSSSGRASPFCKNKVDSAPAFQMES
jgi:hypothetical protein